MIEESKSKITRQPRPTQSESPRQGPEVLWNEPGSPIERANPSADESRQGIANAGAPERSPIEETPGTEAVKKSTPRS